jgi:hypothetical protein
MLQAVSAHWPNNTPPAKIDYRLGELRLTDAERAGGAPGLEARLILSSRA